MYKLSVRVQKGKELNDFQRNLLNTYRDSLKSEVRLPRDKRHISYESNEQLFFPFLFFSPSFSSYRGKPYFQTWSLAGFKKLKIRGHNSAFFSGFRGVILVARPVHLQTAPASTSVVPTMSRLVGDSVHCLQFVSLHQHCIPDV